MLREGLAKKRVADLPASYTFNTVTQHIVKISWKLNEFLHNDNRPLFHKMKFI